jgi:alkylation response protein AidB-like acyl-CoA dehydrogenase
MGLRGNDLRHLYFTDSRVPAENVLGEPGEGFRIAMHILNNGRLSLGTGSVGGAKAVLDLAIEHVKRRRQFDRPLADFELVQDKIAWMVSYLFGLESMAYLTTSAKSRRASSPGIRQTALCSSPGARATCAIDPTRRSSVTCASFPSSRAQTTSCASSSASRG